MADSNTPLVNVANPSARSGSRRTVAAPAVDANAVAAAAAANPAVANAARQAALNQAVAPADGLNAAHSDLVGYLSQNHGFVFEVVAQQLEAVGIQREHLSYLCFLLLAAYLIFGSAARLLCNLIGFGYPMYASVKAIRTVETADDTAWLIYWTCFAVLCLLDFFSEAIFRIFPFYYIFKAMFLVYLYLPQTRGAVTFYTSFVDPLVVLIDTNIARFFPQ